MKELKIGDVVEGRITGIQPYGAFVQINGGISGLIHISEISAGYVHDVSSFVKIGDVVLVKIIDIDRENHQARLSMKALTVNMGRKEHYKHQKRQMVVTIGFRTLAQRLPEWISDTMKEIEHDKV